MGTGYTPKKNKINITPKQINMPTPEDMQKFQKGTISTIQSPAAKSAKSYVELMKRIKGLKKGGSVKKKKKKFPDLSGDGKVTKKDILMARGVIKKKKSKKKKAKK
jgi:hypothetical protein